MFTGLIFAALLLMQQGFYSTLFAQETGPLFTDVSEEAGIIHNRSSTDKTIGQAWGDYDNDGWLDLYVTDSHGRNTLYHNEGDGTFALSPLADQVALADSYSEGVTFIDFDNDGWKDLYVLNWGENTLFHNEGGSGFVDITETAGVGDSKNGKSAAWGDYDQDGFADLYVANWSCSPKCGRPVTGDKDRLFHNNGNGTFSDASNLLGSQMEGAAFVASFTDFDNDGDLDIYLVNDEFINPIGNKLWRNDGPGCDGWCFTEISEEAKADTQLMGMGLATADYDNDGDVDFYFSNAGPMTLLQNQGDGTFADVAQAAGVDVPLSIGWGAVFFDYDNDGWRDLYLAVAEAVQGGSAANPLFHNEGDGSFTNVSALSGDVSDPGRSLGVAYADYNRDGWVDLVVGNHDGGYKLYRNEGNAAAEHHWLALELVGNGRVNRDAIGARVSVTTSDGLTQLQEVQCGSSLGAGNEMALHFGLGEADTATAVNVLWPDGTTQTFENIAADQRITLPYPIDEEAAAAQIEALYGPGSTPPYLNTILLVLIGLGSLILLGLVWDLWRNGRKIT